AGGTHATANTPVATTEETPSDITQAPPTPRAKGKKHARSKRHRAADDPLSLTNAVGGRW
ncbi:MAG: hypothetical protein WC684_03585, partial [Hyphomicrobium sp.]